MPEVRTENQPITRAAIAVPRREMGSEKKMLTASSCGVTIARRYPARPKNAAWPKLTKPVYPISRSRLMAKMAMTMRWVTSSI